MLRKFDSLQSSNLNLIAFSVVLWLIIKENFFSYPYVLFFTIYLATYLKIPF